MIFRREEGKGCIRYAHAAFAFPAKPVTHVSEHLSPMCPVSTLAACPTWAGLQSILNPEGVALLLPPTSVGG